MFLKLEFFLMNIQPDYFLSVFLANLVSVLLLSYFLLSSGFSGSYLLCVVLRTLEPDSKLIILVLLQTSVQKLLELKHFDLYMCVINTD